ncbi:MAG TPA: HD domain-containing protein [Candidatus Saccharimonadia bacterium]
MDELRTEIVRLFQQGSHIAHDEKHALRVAALAKYIATTEDYDTDEAEVAGLLHDMGRTVQDEEKGHGPAGVPLATKLLDEYTSFGAAAKERIVRAVAEHSGLHTEGKLTHIVQDADMIDGLGAIGLARAYTSKAQLPDYDPANIVPTKGVRDTNIHDQIAFQMEWLNFMHTTAGQRIAQKRYDFMKQFLETFRDEASAADLAP